MSLSKSMSSSTTLLGNINFFDFSIVLASFPLETDTMVDEARPADKTRIGPTKGRLRGVLTVSKIDVPPKSDVHVGMGELTGEKIGAKVVEKIVEQVGTLTIHTAVEVDILDVLTTVAEDDSVADDDYSSVDEVVDTCIDDT